MLTRCPQCGTTFRVTPEQLKARQGRVRCGACHDVFNALDTLIELAPPAAPARPATPAAPAIEPESAAPVVVEPATPVEVPPEEPLRSEPTLAEPAASESLPREAVQLEPMEVEPALGEPISAESTLIEFPRFEPAPEPVETVAPPRTEPAPAAPEPVIEAPAAPDPWLAAPFEPLPEAATHRRSGPWTLGVLAAVIAFAAQAALHWRTEIAVLLPEAKPMLAAACATLGCELTLPRKAELIGIEASDLAPDADGRLTLAATLKNRAPFAQEYPNLELTLTDIADRALVRRVLVPGDYLPPQTPVAAGFGANAELAVKLVIEVADLAPAGYRLYLFYP